MKIHPVGAELFHPDRRTEGRPRIQMHMTELIVAFHNFANSSENSTIFFPAVLYENDALSFTLRTEREL
jgi:hypothetical protein